MKYIKLFEELTNPPVFNAKYYWRTTIERIKNSFNEFEIKKEDVENTILLTIINGEKSCELRFSGTDCFLNNEKINVHEGLIEKIKSCLN
jgi:hypothetical protein